MTGLVVDIGEWWAEADQTVILPHMVNKRLPYLIHVDSEMLRIIREGMYSGRKPPIGRVLQPVFEGEEFYWVSWLCDWWEVHGSSWAATTWSDPMPDRPSAICVVKTFSRVTIGIGERR